MEIVVLLSIVIKIINTTDNTAYTCVNINGPLTDYDPSMITSLVETMDWDQVYSKLHLGDRDAIEILKLQKALLYGLGMSMVRDLTDLENLPDLRLDTWHTTPINVPVNERLRVHVKLSTRTNSPTLAPTSTTIH